MGWSAVGLMGWSIAGLIGLIWELSGGGWVDRQRVWWVDRNLVAVDGLIDGGFAGFDRFRLLGRSVWLVPFVRFDCLISCWVWLFLFLFFSFLFFFTWVWFIWFWFHCFGLMGLLGFKNMNSHVLGLIDEERKEWWRTRRTVHACTQLSLKWCIQADFILRFSWEELCVYFYTL